MLALVEQWIRSGVAKDLIIEIQREARARQRLARSIITQPFHSHPTGIHIWLPLPSHWNHEAFTHTLDQMDVNIASAESFSVTPTTPNAVRISLGGAEDQNALAVALRRIQVLIQEDRRRSSMAFV